MDQKELDDLGKVTSSPHKAPVKDRRRMHGG